ncbi:portal protein [Gordonia phage Lilbeanie]|uniref:Portal protein n=1 Tax=Gordonia phage Lilbeanie TaxID=2794947 RepID=A0A7T1NW87_9CAUD|nr:portal protein [Gordonia phage Lilbeanie]QPO17091.1 portal protein [Gordonia phage Lilbeanie]
MAPAIRDGRSDSRAVVPRRRRPVSGPEPVTTFSMLRAVQPDGVSVTTYPIDPAVARTDGGTPYLHHGARGQSLTAAAEVLTGGKFDGIRKLRKRRARAAERWQEEVWQLRNSIGELRFVGDRQARAVSQCRLYIGKRTDKATSEPERVTEGAAHELSEMLFGDQAAVQQQLFRYAQHIVFSGESYFHLQEPEDNRIKWSVHSSSELLGQNWNNYQLTDGVKPVKLYEDRDILLRSWTPDPKLFALADAPVRAVLPVLRELEGLTKYVSAQIDSRLAGSGILLISDRVESLMKKPENAPDDYSFIDELVDYMMEPLEDRGAAGSVVPFVAKVPGDDPSKMMHHLTFDGPLDPHMHERREEAIRRVALGLDSDPSVLLGMADANHWSAWSIDESEVKLGAAPILTNFCHTWTSKVVQHLLMAAGVPDWEDHQVWFDTSPLRLRPDRSTDAKELGNNLMLSEERVRAETGFDESDAPKPEEWKRRYIADLIRSDPANLGPILGKELGIDWPKPETPAVEVRGPATPPGVPGPDEKPEDIARSAPDTRENPPPTDDPSERPQ